MIGLFSFQGRTSRLGYWRTILLCVALAACVIALGYFAIIAVGPPGGVLLVGMAPVLWINFAVALRRLHDRDKGAWWFLMFLFGPAVCGGVAQQLAASEAPLIKVVSLPLLLASLGLNIWGFVELGCLSGKTTTNRLGAAPAIGG